VVKVISRKAALPQHTDGSYSPGNANVHPRHLLHSSLGLPNSASQTASWLVQPFLHSSWQSVPILYNGPPLSPSKLPIRMGDLDPMEYMVS